MGFANASQSALAYVKETVFGTFPSTPTNLWLRNTGNTLNEQRAGFTSNEQRTDGQRPFVRHGMRRVSGNIDFDLAYLALKDIFRAALRYGTANGSFTSDAGVDTAFATGKTFTRTSGSFITNGALVNMKVRVTGSGSNDGVYTINTVTALVITVDETVATEAASADVKMQGEFFDNGTTDESFSMERHFSDLSTPEYDQFTGMVPIGLSIAAAADAIVTGQFEILGRDMTVATTALDATPDDVSALDPCTSFDGTVKEGGAASTILTACNFNIGWGSAGTEVIGANVIQSVEPGSLDVSGSLTAFFQDLIMLNKFMNETESAIELGLQDSAGNEFNIQFPAVKYTSANREPSGDGPLLMPMDFTAYMDATLLKTVLGNMIPAIAV